MSVNMDNNFCTSCGEQIPDGVLVCGGCLKRNGDTNVHKAVRDIESFCKEFRKTHKSCDECILRHHCENKIANWPQLFLRTDMADYEEIEAPRVRKNKSKLSKWLNKNFGYVYIGVAVMFGLIIFGIGLVVGQAFDYYSDKAEAVQAVVEQSKTGFEEAYWFIDTNNGDVNG